MKKTIIVILVILSFITSFKLNAENESNNKEFKGVWVSTVYQLDYPSTYTTNSEKLKEDAIEVIKKSYELGFNAIILQVRPSADAIYKSAYFPYSKYITGTQGLAPNDNFDILDFYIKESHKYGMELHAWINPYRITMSKNDKLAENHIALIRPDWTVLFEDKLFFNPGIKKVRDYIIDGVEEIVRNYDVDGIHFDDYFYPGKEFNDQKEYLSNNPNNLTLDSWRRENNNDLIKRTNEAIKTINEKVVFGVSPSGIWANKGNNSLGSETRGSESYYNLYADTRKWVIEEWLDYIAPQVYWKIGYTIADYEIIAKWWNNVVQNTKVNLYIGIAIYRLFDNSEWEVEEISKQLSLNKQIENIKGHILFRYKNLIGNDNKTKKLVELLKNEQPVNLPTVSNLNIEGNLITDEVVNAKYDFNDNNTDKSTILWYADDLVIGSGRTLLLDKKHLNKTIYFIVTPKTAFSVGEKIKSNSITIELRYDLTSDNNIDENDYIEILKLIIGKKILSDHHLKLLGVNKEEEISLELIRRIWNQSFK
ncbi:family 10 glycosylhydrolase [Haploplasma axanthum]|uniref:Uncharacterized protein conserved in bacteria n=1 Tax=Haploplasma axanthum TaxID=29552 RepID=A0A449BDP2_HAPAX|nr:family 10 glycosylhydrolase [Haploplasma axanthum]VEU80420.1 Uncharacterized protein conserved in bacteria [Haploplasma axanthum]